MGSFRSPRSLAVLLLAILGLQGTIKRAGCEADSNSEGLASGGRKQGWTLTAKSLKRFYDPIEFRAEILGSMVGRRVDPLRMYALRQGRLVQIPFQIDEWTRDGQMILDKGDLANGSLGNGLLDLQDMVVFMARDAGDKASVVSWPGGVDSGVEILLQDPTTGEEGWVYLLSFSDDPPPFPFQDAPRVEEAESFIATGDSYRIVGTNNKIDGKVYRTIVNRHIWVPREAGGDGQDFIDRSKFRVSASLLFGVIKIGFNEDNFMGGLDKYKQGPVRSVGRQWFSIRMPLRLKGPRIYGDVYCYDTMVLIVGQTEVPINPDKVFTNFRMILGYDLHMPNGMGMLWYNSHNPDGFLMDGVTSPMEKHFSGDSDLWRCIVGSNGWIMHRSLWDEDYARQAKIITHYRDDLAKEWPPEYFPGELGYYGVESLIKGLEPRKYQYQMDWYWPLDFYSPEGVRREVIREISNIRDSPLWILVDGNRAANRGAVMTLVEP
jgi:hypothetical protein